MLPGTVRRQSGRDAQLGGCLAISASNSARCAGVQVEFHHASRVQEYKIAIGIESEALWGHYVGAACAARQGRDCAGFRIHATDARAVGDVSIALCVDRYSLRTVQPCVGGGHVIQKTTATRDR